MLLCKAGHTSAKYEDMLIAIANGLKSITHLFSCTSTITRENGFRKLGVIETAFLEKNLFVEAIADGKHLPIELLKMIYQIKGHERMCLVTDSLAAAGTNWKKMVSNGMNCIIEDGVAKLSDRSAFAGSIATADVLLKTAKSADIPLENAVYMLTQSPANLLNLKTKGEIKSGYDADIVLFDDNINISQIIISGKEFSII